MDSNHGTFKSLLILYSYRSRVLKGVVHDVRQRYTGSVFGSLWAVLFPITQLSIYAGLYCFIFRVHPSGLTSMGYVVLIFSGLVPLLAFSDALTAATSSLFANKNLLLNTVFPAELIPLRAVLSAQVTGVIALIITLMVGFAVGRTSWQAVVFVPVFWILLLMFTIGLGWMFSLLTLVAKDIQHGLGLVIMLLFILSPFAYTPEMVPNSMKSLLYLNPLSYFVLTFQKLICYGTMPDPIPTVGAFILGFGSFFLGFNVFKRAKYVFFDYA